MVGMMVGGSVGSGVKVEVGGGVLVGAVVADGSKVAVAAWVGSAVAAGAQAESNKRAARARDMVGFNVKSPVG
jgi:molybdopterin-binding protein